MNSKGFTLIEMIITLFLISIVFTVLVMSVGNTFGLTKEKSYELMKKSIIIGVEDYIYECDNGLVNCENDYEWINEDGYSFTSFKLNILKKYSYLNKELFINPITEEEISDCLIIKVKKDDLLMYDVDLDESQCLK